MIDWLKTAVWRRVCVGLGVLALLTAAMAPVAAQDEADAAAAAGPPKVIDMRILNNAERARLVIDLSGITEFATASLAEPDRIVVDIRATDLAAPVGETEAGEGLIGSYALSVAEQGRVRATLTLSSPAQVQDAYLVQPVDTQPARLIVDMVPDTPTRFAHRVEDDYKKALSRAEAEQAAQAPEQAAHTAGSAGGERPGDIPALPPTGTDERPPARPLIVIDPGHGGIDGGAEAPNGTKEKDIVLKFSRELRRLLVDMDRFDVAMTRDDDSFVRLEDRVKLARANKADLLVSIHADAFQEQDVSGASVYVRDQNATNELDEILAENENRSDLVAGFATPDTDERVTSILVELMQRETRRQSYIAANSMLQALGPSITLRRFPLRKANFVVLRAPEVPSVLVELGFISNPADVANLTTGGWRDKTAEALANGIADYFDSLGVN